MRTTIDLPDELMRAAKVRAAERDESLKELFERALNAELGRKPRGRAASLPVLPTRGPHTPLRDLSNEEIDELLYADDIQRAIGLRDGRP